MSALGPTTSAFVLPAPILRCTVCGSVVDTCTLCGTGLLKEHALRCRRDDGHEHDACAIARVRRSWTNEAWREPRESRPPVAEREKRESGFRSRRSR